MKPYISIYLDELRTLPSYVKCSSICVLMSLISHCDQHGRCYPKPATIASNTGLAVKTVYESLAELESMALIGILQHSQRHQITGVHQPTIYIISPYVYCVRPQNHTEAVALWEMARGGEQTEPPRNWFRGVQNGRDRGVFYTHNQQQNQSSKPPTGPQTEQPTTTTEGSDPDAGMTTLEKPKSEKPKSETAAAAQNSIAPAATPQNSPPGSAAPPPTRRRIDPQPEPIDEPQDILTEAVAKRLNKLGIPMPLSRAYARRYGADSVDKAIAIATKPGEFTRPAAGAIYLLRSIHIKGDDDADRAGDDRSKYTSGKYAAFVEG